MMICLQHAKRALSCIGIFLTCPALVATQTGAPIGSEVSSYQRLENGEEFEITLEELLDRGEKLFRAEWTPQEGGGRPMTVGTGGPLADHSSPLIFPRNFNRVSAQDANSCFGCHNAPFATPGGGGDFTAGAFVAAQRFDFGTFDHADPIIKRGSVDEKGDYVVLATIGNYRASLGMFGSGFIEMLARQMTADLQAIRDSTPPGEMRLLVSKGISFGVIRRGAGDEWDVSQVSGLPEQSLLTTGPGNPSLIIHPFHQSGSVVSLRQFTNNAFNHHHGMQAEERFGSGADPDGDGFVDELTRADITAISVFQAVLPVPGRVVPNDRAVEEAIFQGERLFEQIGCASCHVPRLPLFDKGWIYTEPNPYNPPGNLQVSDAAPTYSVDLMSGKLPGPRLTPENGVVWVPAFTDLKLHDITSGLPDDPNAEAININAPGGSPAFFAGNRRFLTKKLWGAANERPYFHHGKFTTLREATLAHAGEALAARQAFLGLAALDQARVIEFLKSLQVLPPGTKFLVVDENGRRKGGWPPR